MLAASELLKARILVAESRDENTALTAQMLCGAGYVNVTSTHDSSAVCLLHAANRFDIILLDVGMPGRKASQVMRRLNEIEPLSQLPVLVMTAESQSAHCALATGARDFVSKPLDSITLQARLRNLLEMRLLSREVGDGNQIIEEAVLTRTAELHRSEARLKSLLALSADWYWEQDVDGRMTSVSGPALDMLDFKSDLFSQDSHRGYPDRATLAGKIEARLPFLDLLFCHTRADGAIRYMRVSGEPVFDSGSRFTGYRGIGTDITMPHCAQNWGAPRLWTEQAPAASERKCSAMSIDIGNVLD